MIPYAQLRLEERNGANATNIVRVLNLLYPPYALGSYTATVAPLVANQIAGNGQYDDVEDSITLTISADLPATAALAYHDLIAMLDQARRWNDGENVNPIVIVAELQCSTIGPTEAVVLGPSDGAAPGSASPEQTVSAGPWLIPDVTLGFRRRPLWLEPLTDVDSAGAPSATRNPQIGQATFARDGGPILAPTTVFVTDSGVRLGRAPLYLFSAPADESTTPARNPMALISAPLFAPNPGYTTANDAANNPYQGTNVLRYTPTGTTEALSGPVNFTSWDGTPAPARIWAAYAVLRNNSATTSWLLRAYFRRQSAYAAPFATRPVVIAAGVGNPQIVPLGIAPQAMNGGGLVTSIQLGIQASAAAGTLDISHLALVALDGPGVSIVRIEAPASASGALWAYTRHRDAGLYRQSFALLRQSASALPDYAPDVAYSIAPEIPPFDGNADASSSGRVISLLALQTNGASWTLPADPLFLSIGATRRRAYRTPQ